MSKPIIVTLTGPTCAGKSTLEKMLADRGFGRVISTTTRQPRSGEVDGTSYYFVTPQEFTDLETVGGFIETVNFNGNHYGVSVREINRIAAMGKPIVIVVEPHGQEQIKKYCIENGIKHMAAFVCNPPEVIFTRILRRFLEDRDLAGPSNWDSVLETTAKRLTNIVNVEKVWIDEAIKHNHKIYDVIFWEFDERDCHAYADYLRDHCEAWEIDDEERMSQLADDIENVGALSPVFTVE